MKKFILLFFSFLCLSVQAQQWLWGKNGNGSGDDMAYSVSADPNGNLFVTGSFSSPAITFGSITLTNGNGDGENNLFIVKYDANGNVLWAKSAGGAGRASGISVNADAGGNLLVTGIFDGATITFGSITLINTGWGDMFIVKYDPNGNALWAKNAKGNSLDAGESVSTDDLGNVIVTGVFESDTLTFGTKVITNRSSSNHGTNINIFIAKYDANGNVLWVKCAGGTGSCESNSISTDATGNLFVSGYFWGSDCTFDSITLIHGGSFISKYDANGNVLWAKNAARASHTSASADASGNVFVTGYFSDTVTIGSIQLTNVDGGYNFFIAKYDANGNALWAKTQVGGIYVQSCSISADANGNAFVTGYFESPPITFDSITLTPPPANCSYNSAPWCSPMFIVKYDANGNVICASSLASGNGSSVSADPFGNAYIGGWFGVNPFIVNTDTLPFTGTGIGLQNVFVGKFSSGNNIELNVLSNKQQSVSVSPNPTSGIFTVNLRNCQAGTKVTVRDVLGNCLLEKNCRGENSQEINLSSQPRGIYFVELLSGDERVVRKVAVQ